LKIKGQATARASGSRRYDDQSRSPSPGGRHSRTPDDSRSPSPRGRDRDHDDEGMNVDGRDNEEERTALARKESELKEKALRNKVMKSRKTSNS
jgi:serine/arginine repetitive matrix protein 1